MTVLMENTPSEVLKRDPKEILSLKKMGTSFSSRLSFMRNLVRKIHHQNWRMERRSFAIDENGFGHAVYTAHTPERAYSLVVFTHDLDPEKRTDRVIAEAWDATFNLFDGLPTDEDIRRLEKNTPLQEAGRFLNTELVTGRANKSLRMFATILDSLKAGRQPDVKAVGEVGYLMRTTAVYGSGKFGGADRMAVEGRSEIQASFHAEMLAVYLFRSFTIDLMDHMAQAQAPDTAVRLDDRIKRFLGIGNSTGLGMAPFLLKHTKLMHQWVNMKEEALRRTRAQIVDAADAKFRLCAILPLVFQHLEEWNVEDNIQMKEIVKLRAEVKLFGSWLDNTTSYSNWFWNDVYNYASDNFSLETVSLVESMIIECNGDLVDELGDQMFEASGKEYDPAMTVLEIKNLIAAHYDWVNDFDFAAKYDNANFWYYSEEKLEPRFGNRHLVQGEELEMPLAIARDIVALNQLLNGQNNEMKMADFAMTYPDFRHVIKRVQTVARYPYGEVYDNLIGEDTRPIDLLRFKLAFFGANKFDPKSSLWTRINMYQGAPLFDEITTVDPDAWAYPVLPEM